MEPSQRSSLGRGSREAAVKETEQLGLSAPNFSIYLFISILDFPKACKVNETF